MDVAGDVSADVCGERGAVCVGAVFVGGRSERMGGVDKGALMLGGEAMGARVVGQLRCQVERVVAVGDERPDWLMDGFDVIGDPKDAHGVPLGPAGGLLAALAWAGQCFGEEAMVATMPVDVPFAPGDLVARLREGLGQYPGVVARTSDGLQGVFGLWRAGALAAVERAIVVDGVRALHVLVDVVGAGVVDVAASEHAFLNVNTPEDYERALGVLKM